MHWASSGVHSCDMKGRWFDPKAPHTFCPGVFEGEAELQTSS